MKNSGSSFVKEVATRDFMEEVTHLIKVPVSDGYNTYICESSQLTDIYKCMFRLDVIKMLNRKYYILFKYGESHQKEIHHLVIYQEHIVFYVQKVMCFHL
jgi:hypothetical protein